MVSENSPKNQTEPIVSIIIPFFNREEFLGEAIESVLKQSVNEWELILIDDGSTDKSVEIVRTFVKKYSPKIHLLRHEKGQNKGASASRNLGIARAVGKFITFLDSDDVFFPDTLERELEAFENNPEADAVCGTLECWHSWSVEAEKWEKDFIVDLVLETEKLYQPPDLLIHNLNASGRKPGINCVMVKSDFAKNFVLFENDCRYAWEDQVFWTKVSLHGKIYVMDAVLSKYRQHPASTVAIDSKESEDISRMLLFSNWLEEYLNEQNISNRLVWKALEQFKRNLQIENKLKWFKQMYRRLFPLHLRYKIRDKWTRTKQILSRPAHRHK